MNLRERKLFYTRINNNFGFLHQLESMNRDNIQDLFYLFRKIETKIGLYLFSLCFT